MYKIRTLLIFIIFLFLSGSCLALEAVRIDFIDVGDSGDAILIKTLDNNALIDSGGLLYGYGLMEYLGKHNAVKLDYFIITHPHLDHMAGAFFIIPRIAINQIYDNGQELSDGDDIYRWYRKLVRTRGNYLSLKAGDRLKMGDVFLEVLWPDKPNITNSANANSLVIMLEYKDFRCLLAADLNNIGERQLLLKGLNLKSQILKLGHHGYFDATSKEFLEAVSPRCAIITVDANNIRGAPSEATLNLLKEKGIKLYRTDKNGHVVVLVDEKGNFRITTEK
jgi:competence protein ComEC